jgi:23S rRNA (cytidine2498-2'-O)-methyltransferase
MSQAEFIFVTCQLGAEAAVKRELASAHPELHLAYSRPGFLTFKNVPAVDAGSGVRLHSTFARTWGLSLGRVTGNDPAKLAQQVWRLAAGREFEGVHLWQRDTAHVGQRGFEPHLTPAASDAATRLAAAALESAAPLTFNQPIHPGRIVLDCILVEPNEWWVGYHRTDTLPSRYPGGLLPIEAEPAMVSRAYLKMQEAILWSGFPFEPGEVCVELGSAPGGASQALLALGLKVRGIDPAAMDPQVLANPNFTHLQMRGADLKRREYADVDWLVADVILVPEAMLRIVEPIVEHPSVEIRGLLLTLKLNQLPLVDRVPSYLARIKSWGYDRVRAWQLAHNRQEICVAAFKSPPPRPRPKRKTMRQRRRA